MVRSWASTGMPSTANVGSFQFHALSIRAGRPSVGSVRVHTLPTGICSSGPTARVWLAGTSRVPSIGSPVPGSQM